jgi:CBS domain-containing protein/ribosome-associated translation inhibitor RaiA
MEVVPATVLDASEPVSKAASEITKNGTLVIVTKGKRYHGIIDDRALRNSRNDTSKTKCEALCERAPFVKINDTLVEICKAFFAGRFSALPVVSGNTIEGVITRADVIKLLLAEKLLDGKKVSEAMSSPVLTIAHNAGMGTARKLMREKNVRRLVVTKNERLAGIISTFDLASIAAHERDVRPSGMSEKYSAEKEWVERFMRDSIETITPDAPLGDAARKMLDTKVASVVVVGGGKAVGIITAKDLFETALVLKEADRVFISGLHDLEKEYYHEVHEECEKTLSKLSKIERIGSLALHIKKYGNQYAIHARLNARQLTTASANGFDLHACVAQVLEELKTQVEKRKPNKMHERGHRR